MQSAEGAPARQGAPAAPCRDGTAAADGALERAGVGEANAGDGATGVAAAGAEAAATDEADDVWLVELFEQAASTPATRTLAAIRAIRTRAIGSEVMVNPLC
jgi:hypothetical protein